MKRLGLVLTATVIALLGAAAPAYSYPVNVTPIVGPSDSTPPPGGLFTATARHFCPDATVSFYLDGDFVGESVANGSGDASLLMQAPLIPGPYELKATAANCDGPDSALSGGPSRLAHSPAQARNPDVAISQIVVTDDTGLPDTGSNSGLPLQAGIVLLVAGAGLASVAAMRRRKPASA